MLIALPNAFGDAATNMAIDAALLESMPTGLAAFRHYGWLEPAATFGYAQIHAEVEHATSSGLSLCRRLTGGGIVDHRNDWTYALIIHTSLACAATPATRLYQLIHKAIGSALKTLEVESQLAPCPKACNAPNPISHIPSPISHIPYPISHIPYPISHIPEGATQCFVTPVANDVLRPDGQKIAGAAMKRNRHGLLIQGSLDRGALPEGFDYAAFQQQLIKQLATELDLPTGELEDIRPLFNSERIEHEKQRFAGDAWNQRR